MSNETFSAEEATGSAAETFTPEEAVGESKQETFSPEEAIGKPAEPHQPRKGLIAGLKSADATDFVDRKVIEQGLEDITPNPGFLGRATPEIVNEVVRKATYRAPYTPPKAVSEAAAGAYNRIAKTAEGFATLEGVVTTVGTVVAPEVFIPAMGIMAAPRAFEGAKATYQAAKAGDVQTAVDEGLGAALDAAMVAGGGLELARTVPKVRAAIKGVPPEDAAPMTQEAAKVTPPEPSTFTPEEAVSGEPKAAPEAVAAESQSPLSEPQAPPSEPKAPLSEHVKGIDKAKDLKDAGFTTEEELVKRHAEEGLKADEQFDGETPEEYLMRIYCQ